MNTHKIKIKSRFYINDSTLDLGKIITIKEDIFHHLSVVLRCNINDFISLFNEIDGEFIAQITSLNKKEAQATVKEQIKKPKKNKYQIHLAYAPLKKDANDYTIEKSCELGITEITQVITQNTSNKPLELNKLWQKLSFATQQCERLDIPKVNNATTLSKFLDANKNKKIFWLYERKSENSFSEYLHKNSQDDFSDIIILIGPEGGFSNNEVTLLSSLKYVHQVHLNTNILRAETACIVALVNFQVIYCNL